jgi:hypothetical protein
MAEQNWYFASEGKQQGPYGDAQLRDLIGRGTITADTLVWCNGMAGWQRAAEIPGLMPAGSAPPALAGNRAVAGAAAGAAAGTGVTADFTTFGLFGRVVLFVLGTFLIVPAPWVATILYRWCIERIRVPGRPNLAFTGQPLDIWYVFMLTGLIAYAGVSGIWWLTYLMIPVNAFLGWMAIKWIASNISSDGQKLPISFEGSPWGYIGWFVLMYVSLITIVGWAWVTTAWMRWMCSKLTGTRRAVVFKGTGLSVLWRTLVFALACVVIIPIPWMIRWYADWYISQFELVQA